MGGQQLAFRSLQKVPIVQDMAMLEYDKCYANRQMVEDAS